MSLQYWSYFLGSLDIIGLAGLWMLGKKRAEGWLFAIVTQLVWITYSIITRQWGFLLPALVKFAIYSRNYVMWLRQRERTQEI